MPPGKNFKIVVLGAKGTGKTAIIEQTLYGSHVVGTPLPSTIEDTYVANVLSEKNQPEQFRIYDTAGLDCQRPVVPRHYFSFADAYILVFDITKWETFHCLNALKVDIERNHGKKESPVIMVLGNKVDLELESRQIDSDIVQKWASKEKVNCREVSVRNKKALMDAFCWLATKLTPTPPNRGFSLKSIKKGSSQGGGFSAMGPAADV